MAKGLPNETERLDREGEDLTSGEAGGRRQDPQTDHPDPSGYPGGIRERFDGDVALLRLRDPEDDSGFGLVDVPLTLHPPILRDERTRGPGGAHPRTDPSEGVGGCSGEEERLQRGREDLRVGPVALTLEGSKPGMGEGL